MLVKERFYSFLLKKNKTIVFITIIFIGYFSSTKAIEKTNIINNFNSSETLKFDFIQKSFDKNEKGVCFLKRPHFLRCVYKDKNQKELIINKRVLVIYHKRYNKIYRYPVSKSFFTDILNKEKFSKLISSGENFPNKNFFEIKYLNKNKGEITLFFNKKNYNLNGWRLVDINNNITLLEIKNLIKNYDINKNFFLIPEENQ